MIQALSTPEFLAKASHLPILDVRAPLEYAAGHIPGATSFPLFTDEERKQVGTTYKQVSQDQAILLGLDFFGPKMSGFVRQATALAPEKEVLLHCWRGGMRSGSVAWLLNLAGFRVNLLQHGYKDFRRYVLEQFDKKYRFVVLGGLTGSGKTDILKELAEAGEQVVDLEKLASHKGSSFGNIGLPPQPTIEQFENELALTLTNLDPTRPIWIEDENITIGRINLPRTLFTQMQAAPFIRLEVPRPLRIRKLAQEYCQTDPALLQEAVLRIKKRLGGLATKEALLAIEAGDMEKMVDLVLAYYDKAYGYQLAAKQPSQLFILETNHTQAAENAERLRQLLRENIPALAF